MIGGGISKYGPGRRVFNCDVRDDMLIERYQLFINLCQVSHSVSKADQFFYFHEKKNGLSPFG